MCTAMAKLIFDPKKEEALMAIRAIRDILINSKAICCEDVAPEIMFNGHYSYLLHGYDHRVTVNFNKMTKTLYDAGYRKGED